MMALSWAYNIRLVDNDGKTREGATQPISTALRRQRRRAADSDNYPLYEEDHFRLRQSISALIRWAHTIFAYYRCSQSGVATSPSSNRLKRRNGLSIFSLLDSWTLTHMFLILVTVTASDERVQVALPAHRAFIREQLDAGTLLLTGMKREDLGETKGGMMLFRAANRSDLSALLRNDAFFRDGIADYAITAFRPSLAADGLEALLEPA